MTSKAAKKAYREASKLPKISNAERRRLEAEEIARQKKEWEKEKAAAKAKAAREKKLKKEAEEKEKRKKLGLPEPNRFVRPSQPTIKTFVKSGLGKKRSRAGEADGEDPDSGNEDDSTHIAHEENERPAKRTALSRADEDDDFGDFPSLSQVDLPSLFAEPDSCQKKRESLETSSTVPLELSPIRPRGNDLTPEYHRSSSPKRFQPEQDARTVENRVLAEAKLTETDVPFVLYTGPAACPPKTISSVRRNMQLPSTTPPYTAARPLDMKNTILPEHPNKTCGELEKTASMPPPPIPIADNRLWSRNPLGEISRNVASPSRPSINPLKTTSRVTTQIREDSSILPPSTQAFLESHLDDFFPSPSQQVRELLEDIDDMPSNTQVAREIEQEATMSRSSLMPAPLPKSQPQVEDDLLSLLSSQDLNISSQDLKDINTPSKSAQTGLLLSEMESQRLVENEDIPPPPPSPTPKSKRRFFEEKEDDLLHAALHESLLLAKQFSKGSSPRRSERILRRTQSTKITREDDDYGSDGSDIDPELLALLDGAKCDAIEDAKHSYSDDAEHDLAEKDEYDDYAGGFECDCDCGHGPGVHWMHLLASV
jgi:hypothetical protein